ncbi:HAD-IA family hydrolase [Alcanivorax limicola]|uniref:HAD-IA family hydrolase n=1 Tax=Alcanivorax limicola TaxID=2874102 RepID=UPI001CBC8357|nr:HAD-IA family hydrolase [Alcanivorax limicola]
MAANTTMTTAIRAIFFDFGGVISTSPFDALRDYEHARGLPTDFLRQTNAINPDSNAWARFERGDITLPEFDAAFLAETRARGHAVPGRDLPPLLATQVRPGMLRVLDALRDGYQLACLTNNLPVGHGAGMSLDTEGASTVADAMTRFDFVLESSKAGVRKPEAAFYQLACEKAGVPAEAVVFLDDLGINLKSARALGMHTIKVTAPDTALHALQTILGRNDLIDIYRAAGPLQK